MGQFYQNIFTEDDPFEDCMQILIGIFLSIATSILIKQRLFTNDFYKTKSWLVDKCHIISLLNVMTILIVQ